MRLWSIHPRYFDDFTLREWWKDAVVANRALWAFYAGKFHPYKNHPHLMRFKSQDDPLQAIYDYVAGISDVMQARKLSKNLPLLDRGETHIPVTAGQMEFEAWHYGAILSKKRGNAQAYYDFWSIPEHDPHPIFVIVRGPVEKWESIAPNDYTTCKRCGGAVYARGRGQPPKTCENCRRGKQPLSKFL